LRNFTNLLAPEPGVSDGPDRSGPSADRDIKQSDGSGQPPSNDGGPTQIKRLVPVRPEREPAERDLAQAVVEDGLRRYFLARRGRVEAFVTKHFSLRGTLSLHREALGWDIVKAPVNLAFALPQLGLKATAAAAGALGAKRAARRLGAQDILLRTKVTERTEWLIVTELLELPFQQQGCSVTRDALAETILADPRVEAFALEKLAAIGRRADDPEFRRRLGEAMGAYAGTRAAAADITTGLLTLGAGAVALKQLVPGAMTLGPALATAMAQQAAIASFPLGASLGGLWYGAFPAAASPALMFGLTGGLMAVAAVASAFAGILADPIQVRLGLHQRRLQRMLDALERQIADPDAPAFAVKDQYAARLMDLFDLIGTAYRVART
jgi:hypothetical protein